MTLPAMPAALSTSASGSGASPCHCGRERRGEGARVGCSSLLTRRMRVSDKRRTHRRCTAQRLLRRGRAARALNCALGVLHACARGQAQLQQRLRSPHAKSDGRRRHAASKSTARSLPARGPGAAAIVARRVFLRTVRPFFFFFVFLFFFFFFFPLFFCLLLLSLAHLGRPRGRRNGGASGRARRILFSEQCRLFFE